MKITPEKPTSQAQVAATLRALADVVEAKPDETPIGPVYIVGLEKWAEYGFTSYESIKSAAAQGLKVCKGPRGRLMATVEDARAIAVSSAERHERRALSSSPRSKPTMRPSGAKSLSSG